MLSKSLRILFVVIAFGEIPAFAASGMFPKMPFTTNTVVADIRKDSDSARMTAWALQGLINQISAEIYVLYRPFDMQQLEDSGRSFEKLDTLPSANGGLRSLLKKYQGRVKKMIVYDSQKDWTWYLALMAGAQEGGIPVTESLKNDLIQEFGWKGDVEDFQNRWTNRIEAFDWALANLMPACNKQVIFALGRALPLNDYVVASKGFVFGLDFQKDGAEINKIFQTKDYSVGTSLMGYSSTGDQANETANRYGIGYVVSDFYANGSFWSSFPDKSYTQAPGRAIAVQPGKIYVSFMWSDGDNIQFDQNAIYHLWKDSARGTVPVGTTLGPSLQELNTPLLDWYYRMMTTNDELMAGPCGVQFIYGKDFNPELFLAWCNLNKLWLSDGGFHTACLWFTPFLSYKYASYVKTCGLTGIFLGDNRNVFAGAGVRCDLGMPAVDCSLGGQEKDIFGRLSEITPNDQYPLFRNFTCGAGDFEHGNEGGYLKIKRQVDRLEAAYPGRFVFLLPKDQFATIQAYCRLRATPEAAPR